MDAKRTGKTTGTGLRTGLSRRELLRAGGAASLAIPYVITSAALGSPQQAAASDRITVGHIGVGGRGRDLFRGFQGVRDAQSLAVADCYRDRREALAAICQGKAYQDFRELLARDDIDAVVVATPDHWHVPIAILAARAGKSAYVEKPLGLSIQQNLACQETFAAAGTVFQYGTQQRSMAHCLVGCEMVRRGKIGQVVAIEVDAPNGGRGGSTQKIAVPDGFDYDMWLGPAPVTDYTADRCKPPGTYWVYDQSIGYLAGWGAHPLDIMVWGCDADLSGPVVVEGTGSIPSEGLYDSVYNWDMKIKLGQVDLVFRPGSDRTKFIGENGWIQVCRNPNQTTASDPSWLQTKVEPGQSQLVVSRHQQANFIQAIKQGDPQAAVSNLQDAVRSDIISHLCDIAVRSQEQVTWDPQQRQLVDASPAAQAMLHRPLREPWTL